MKVIPKGDRFTVEMSRDELTLNYNALADFRAAPEERKLRSSMLAVIEPHSPADDDDLQDDNEEGSDLLSDLGGGDDDDDDATGAT